MQTSKTCTACGLEKPVSEFHRRNGRSIGYQPKCKPCRSAISASRYQNNPEVRASIRRRELLSRYGITPEEREEAIRKQGGRCAVCKETLRGGTFDHTDHCHVTGKFRGVLCSECNTGIGKLHDDPSRLLKAALYLIGN